MTPSPSEVPIAAELTGADIIGKATRTIPTVGQRLLAALT